MASSTTIRRWSSVLNVLAIVAIVIISAAVVLGALFSDLPADIRSDAGVGPNSELSRAWLITIAAIGALPVAAMIYALTHVRALFARYSQGETLTPACAKHIHQIGMGLLASAMLGLVTRPIQIMLASLSNPPGERVLALGVGSADLGLVLAGGLMLTIGWVMGDAARIAEDSKSIV